MDDTLQDQKPDDTATIDTRSPGQRARDAIAANEPVGNKIGPRTRMERALRDARTRPADGPDASERHR